MTALEKEIEAALVRVVRQHGGRCLKWVCPGWAGVPDRIILLPNGVVMFAELKRPKGGKVSPRQKWWAKELKRMGFICATIWDMRDVAMIDQALTEVLAE